MNPNDLPQDLQQRYINLNQASKAFEADYMDYVLSKIPRYVSIPQWLDENEISATYEEMKELADLAREKSLRMMKPIKMGSSPIGTLYCFLGEIIEISFNDLTAPEDED